MTTKDRPPLSDRPPRPVGGAARLIRVVRHFPRFSKLGVLLLALPAVVFFPWPAGAQQGARFEAEFAVTRSPDTPVLELSYDLPSLPEADPAPFLTVFGSGRYIVHRPFYMKQAGDWAGQLARQELEELFSNIVSAGLLDVDYDRFAGELRERRLTPAKALDDRDELTLASERETTIIRVRLERYKPKGVLGVAGQPLEKTLHVSNLAVALEANPDIATLQDLSSLTSRLRALAERPELELLEPTGGTPVR